MRRPRSAVVRVLTLVLASTLVGCAPPPTAGPHLATDYGGSHDDEDVPAPGGPPVWSAPTEDLTWTPCPRAVPEPARAECATLRASERDGTLPVALVRLTTPATPAGAPPLVVTPGPDTPAEALASRLAADAPALADAHPLVVVEHRARSGRAGRCLDPRGARALDTIADEGVDVGAPEARESLAAAAQGCLDAIEGAELRYGSDGAVGDLDALRTRWKVSSLALLSVGEGSRTSLRYATAHPDATALLVLDSPAPLPAGQQDLARAAVDGSEAALRQWSAACRRPECGDAPADSRYSRVADAVHDARRPGGRIAGAALVDVVRSALADLSGASGERASEGDRLLGALVTSPAGSVPDQILRAAAAVRPSPAFVADCTDLAVRVPVSAVRGLAAEWAPASPAFGEVVAAQTARCSTWPAPDRAPVVLPRAAPILLLASSADPVGGAAAGQMRAGELTAAGAGRVHTVAWQSAGSAVLLHSACARTAAASFLSDPSAASSTACAS